MAYNIKIRFNAIQSFINDRNLINVALHYGVHVHTLRRWVKNYQNDLLQGRSLYIPPWNRFSKKLERRIVRMKEEKPQLSLRQARQYLQKESINISLKGIYNIWLRYGLIKRATDDIFMPFSLLCKESERLIEQIKILVSQNKNKETIKKVTQLINTLPSYPLGYDELIKELPEHLLSPRRRLDWLYANFLNMPMPVFVKKAKGLRNYFEKKHLFYSACLSGILELLGMHWMRNPAREIALNKKIQRRLKGIKEPAFYLSLNFLQGAAYAEALQFQKAKECAVKIKRTIHSLKNARLDILYADLLTFLSEYKKAVDYYYRGLALEQDILTKKRGLIKLAISCIVTGDYRQIEERCIKHLKLQPDDDYYTSFVLVKSLLLLSQGDLSQAAHYLRICIDRSKKEQLRNYISTAAYSLAAIEQALGRTDQARKILKKYLRILKKHKVRRETVIFEYILGERKPGGKIKKFPIFYFLNILRQAKEKPSRTLYKKIINYSQKKGLNGFLHRSLIFFPEIVIYLLKKGEKVHLPRKLLMLPVFNKETPNYRIEILGNIRVYKNNRYLKIHLTPKQKAVLIHIAIRLSNPGQTLSLNELKRNFWPKAKYPGARFSHTLIEIKNKLGIPGHLLRVRYHRPEGQLVNNGIFYSTDYDLFNTKLTEAKILDRLGEVGSTLQQYRQCFKLFRGDPFERIYDRWSEQLRRAILNKLESELKNFYNYCKEHNIESVFQQVRSRITKICNITI